MYTLADLRTFGRKRGWCPYFLARHMMAFANVVVYNYQYMIDPKVWPAACAALVHAGLSHITAATGQVCLQAYLAITLPAFWLACMCPGVPDGVPGAGEGVCGGL